MKQSYSQTEKRRAIQPVWNALAHEALAVQGQGLVLAVSGGVDSLALMEGYARWPQAQLDKVWVASLDHGQRDESHSETERILKRAHVLGFKGFSDSYCGSRSQNEASLRNWRYGTLERLVIREGLYGIVTAHHRTDDAEGFVMDMMGVGGGQQGRGMKVQQKRDAAVLLRPFLSLSRDTLALALSAMGVAHHSFEDPSDAKDQNWRAFVRHEILPSLKKVQPRIVERLSQKAKEQDDVLDSFEILYEEYVRPSPKDGYLVDLKIPTEFLLKMVCIGALKRVSPESDMRSGDKTLVKISQRAFSNRLKTNKVFEFSGAQIEVLDGFLWVRSRK